MEMKKITNLANIKIKNYKFVILDIKKVRTNFKFRIILLKNGVIFLNVKRLHKIGKLCFSILVTGCWKKESLAPRVALLPFIKSTEYLVNPASSIQYPATWSIAGAAFCPNMAKL